MKRIPYDQKRPMEDCPLCAGSPEPGWVCAVHWRLPWGHDNCGWEARGVWHETSIERGVLKQREPHSEDLPGRY